MERIESGAAPLPPQEVPPLTTYEVSRYLHVDLTTVINWCEQGKLRAYRTPGGHRRVLAGDFMQFLQEYRMPMPADFKERVQGTLKILVVDDEQDIRRTILRALRKKIPSAQMLEAQDGFEAGKMVLDYLPRLVILDLRLPGIDGFRVCAALRKDERFNGTKILAVTGQHSDENRKKILDAGADDYLAKPFGVDELFAKVARLLGIAEGRAS